MAADSVLFIGWNRALPGHEAKAIELLFQSLNYFAAQAKAGNLDSFQPVLLRPHGGDLNGFVMITDEESKLDALVRSDEFQDLVVAGQLLLDGLGVTFGDTGEAVARLIQRIQKHL